MRDRSVIIGVLLLAAFMALFVLAMAGDAALGHPRDGFLLPGLFAQGFGALTLHGLLAGKVWSRASLTERAGFVRRAEGPDEYWLFVASYGVAAGFFAHLAWS